MKKPVRALALALCLCLGLALPALAAEPDELLTAESRWIDVSPIEHEEKTFQLRSYDSTYDEEEGSKIFLSQEIEEFTTTVSKFYRGTRLTVTPESPLQVVKVFSDPDGDGIYDERMTQVPFERVGDFHYDRIESEPVLLPAGAAGPFEDGMYGDGDAYYSQEMLWKGGANTLEFPEYAKEPLGWSPEYTGYRMLDADWLIETYGVNSLLRITDGEGNAYHLLLMDEERPADDSLDSHGLYIADCGARVDSWAKEAVNKAAASGLVDGSLAARKADFRTDMTREEFASVLVNLYEAMSGKDAPDPDSVDCPFEDLSGWFSDSVLQAYALGLVSGTGDTTFTPEGTLNREQAATMLARLYTVLGKEVPAAKATSFADNASISAWAKTGTAFVAEHGIASGVGDNKFAPQKTLTIQEAVIMARRMLENLG